ncbi:MAG: hypothetical protein ACW98D_09660 [Promethearchaeota archaeon]|jgi:hypothetical protein
MSNRKKNYSRVVLKTLIIVFMISLFIIPVFFGNLKTNSIIDFTLSEDALNSSEFTKENYTAILTGEDYGLGSVTIEDIHFNIFLKGVENNTLNYPLLENDLISGALDTEIENVDFIETIKPAIVDNLNGTYNDLITVKLNESLKTTYNNPQEGYLIYFSHFSGARLLDFYVDNGSSVIKLEEDIDYTIDTLGYIVFYYEDYFQKGPIFNFTMHLIWEYDLRLQEWIIEQKEETPLIMKEKEQNFTSRFLYRFFLFGYIVIPDLSGVTPLDYVDVALTINPPDKELLTYQALNINTFDKNVNDYVNPDKSFSIEISDLFRSNGSIFLLNFTTTFRLKFEEPVGYSWAIDRLVAGRDIRERIYFISVVIGPPHILLKNVALYEPGIFYDWRNIKTGSLFNRVVQFFDANASIPRQTGLKVIMPYVILGETCPFSITYTATETLKIIVTDMAKMPLIGVNIEILHFGVKYGTYISNKSVQPIHPGTTDENGQLIIYDVPRGNYTVRVMWEGKVAIETTVTTDKEINYILTTIPHFPLWILIFGTISGIFLLVGALFYLKNKKKIR